MILQNAQKSVLGALTPPMEAYVMLPRWPSLLVMVHPSICPLFLRHLGLSSNIDTMPPVTACVGVCFVQSTNTQCRCLQTVYGFCDQ